MASNVLHVLKRLALKDKAIILTIHQPSSELFSLFDKLLLMAEGRVAFLGTPQEATDFFTQMNAPCPNNYNPADFYVQHLAIVPGKEDESRDTIRKICDAYAVSELSNNVMEVINSLKTNANGEQLLSADGNGDEGYRASWWTQLRAILWRSWLTVLKEPLLVRVRLIQTVVSTYSNELHYEAILSRYLFIAREKLKLLDLITDGRTCNGSYILWSGANTRWCYEYQWRIVLILN